MANKLSSRALIFFLFFSEILQSSRYSRTEQSIDADFGLYQNLNETHRVRDANEILGPLPRVPNGSDEMSWSNRMSTVSGIYEEIVEPSDRFVVFVALHWANNLFSFYFRPKNGTPVIYEEMRLNRPDTSSSPPPLPSRVRKNTDCSSLQRSYTTPESEMVKKKWNLFENVFGKSKRGDTKRRERMSPKPRELQLLKAKRNSFSSPDLSHLDASFNNSSCANCSLEAPSNISSSNSYELEKLCEDDVDHSMIELERNISRNINPNFELKFNINVSTVNLVGCNYNLDSSIEKHQTPKSSPPGYLEMLPGKGFDRKKVEELDAQLKNDVLYRLKYSFDSPITYKREFDYDIPASIAQAKPESVYVCMTKGKAPGKPFKSSSSKTSLQDEPTYMPMNRAPAVIVAEPRNIQSFLVDGTNINSSKNKRHSVDDKVPSYYPNYDAPVKCRGVFHVQKIGSESPSYKTSPHKVDPSERATFNGSNATKTPSRKARRADSFNMKSTNDNNNNVDDSRPALPKKYATLARETVSNTSDENRRSPTIKKSGSISPTSIKRFTSLPRFRKFDFSPLRLKFSSVLQRNNWKKDWRKCKTNCAYECFKRLFGFLNALQNHICSIMTKLTLGGRKHQVSRTDFVLNCPKFLFFFQLLTLWCGSACRKNCDVWRFFRIFRFKLFILLFFRFQCWNISRKTRKTEKN